jgi:hypothetical protein
MLASRSFLELYSVQIQILSIAAQKMLSKKLVLEEIARRGEAGSFS